MNSFDFTKEDYLKRPVVKKFLCFLEKVIEGNIVLDCSYVPATDKKHPFNAKSIEDGVVNYRWAGKNYLQNKSELEILSKDLQIALDNNDEKSALINSLKVLVWGQVYRGSVDWLTAIAEHGCLVEKIILSKNILEGDTSEGIELFSGATPLRCDSGTTKVFSLAASKSVIYDGRVACALGMFIFDFLKLEGISELPPELDFLMDSNSSRNPSAEHIKFSSKSSQSKKALNHAISNLKLNWLLEHLVSRNTFNWKAVELTNSSSITNKMRAIEASLFMIGYQVNKDHYASTGFYLISKPSFEL